MANEELDLSADPKWRHAALLYREVRLRLENAASEEHKLRATLAYMATAKRTYGSGVEVLTSSHKGAVDYTAVPEFRGVNLDSYRKAPVAVWRIVHRPSPKFHRTRGSRPLPAPERGGSLDELRRFLNVDHQGWTLIKAFLVAALRPGVPCPILVAKGEQGAGKTTACRIISALIDPRTRALRGVPREVRDLTAAARNSWIVASII
jgi:hypothetical protein